MNMTKTATIVFVLLGILIPFNALGDDTSSQRSGRRHHVPPPEAYEACEGKNAGDTAEFVSPHGDTVTGTCVQEADRLVLHPDHHPRDNEDGETMDRASD